MNVDTPTLPPHDEKTEQAVLGALLIGGSIDDVAAYLSVEDWYFVKHRAIYAAMLKLSRQNAPVEHLSIVRELEVDSMLTEAGGASYLAELMADTVSTSNLMTHVRMVKEYSSLRALRRIGQIMVNGAEEKKPAEEIATQAEHNLFSAMWAGQVRAWSTMHEVMNETLDHLDAMEKRGDQLSGITTGLRDLDAYLGGWQPSDLVIVAARPSMGKTALMCGAIIAAAKSGKHVVVSSLEMSKRQLGTRMVAIEERLDVFQMNNGRLRPEDAASASRGAMRLSSLPIHIDDAGLLTMDHLRAKVRQLKVKGKCDVLFVDYLQLMTGGKGKKDSRQVEVSEISRGMKLLAKELGITVVALSQLSRKCEEREDRRPLMSDIRESGAIEQDADIILALYRDEVYNMGKECADKGIAEILIRKHRNGPIGEIKTMFFEASARFANLTTEHGE